MAQQQQQGGGGNDSGLGPVWIIAVLFLFAFLIWHFASQYIVMVVFKLKIGEGVVINFFTGTLSQDLLYMETVDPKSVTWNQMVQSATLVGNYFRYLVVVVAAGLAFYLYRSDVTQKFRKVYDMHALRAQEKGNWPQIVPVANLDLVSQDINKGPWAMALSPIEFARKYNLLKKDDFSAQEGAPKTAATIKRGEAKRIFTLQLGPYWPGFDRLSGPHLALAAIFAAKANRDRDGSVQLMQQISKSSDSKLDFSNARALMNKHKNTDIVQDVISKHAYTLTVMGGLLNIARDDGVLASADFLWLKPIDRRLWYMLNSIGRQTPFAEVAGPFAHFKAEILMGRRSRVPMVEEAVKALELAVKEVKLPAKELEAL